MAPKSVADADILGTNFNFCWTWSDCSSQQCHFLVYCVSFLNLSSCESPMSLRYLPYYTSYVVQQLNDVLGTFYVRYFIQLLLTVSLNFM